MPRFFLGWVYGPWAASAVVNLAALRLLIADDFSLHGHGWSLFGSGAICFSIGCVSKVSWELAKLNRNLPRDRQNVEHMVLH
ncbi:MAG: hypothetical protein NTW02_13165 [Cyanobium sp. LacPavin_0920_WC12_MAG_62_9]|nr:hypothetical protein [Cyanobium sp. LacPavin_0920_WC12_MAG_62_9]